jgi:hypothetical protein
MSHFLNRLGALALLGAAACGGQPRVIFHVSSPDRVGSISVAPCKEGQASSDCFANVVPILLDGQASAQGAVFDLPAGVNSFALEVLQGPSAAQVCKRTRVTLDKNPVEITITTPTPQIDCASCSTPCDCGSAGCDSQ